jgi:hypothetical protein
MIQKVQIAFNFCKKKKIQNLIKYSYKHNGDFDRKSWLEDTKFVRFFEDQVYEQW